MSDSEKILNEDELRDIGFIIKDKILEKCYSHPDKTFNEIFNKIKQEIFEIEYQTKYIASERQTFSASPYLAQEKDTQWLMK